MSLSVNLSGNKRGRANTGGSSFTTAPKGRSFKSGQANRTSRVAAQVLAQMKAHTEKKVRDIAAAVYACDTTGSVTLLNGVSQGTDFTNRIGRKTTSVAVQLEGFIGPQDLAVSTTKCKIMIVYDTQPNQALPAITDILTASTSASFMNLDNRDRFRVVYEENVTLAAVNNTATQAVAGAPLCHNISLWRKVDLETIWDNTGGTIAEITSGSLLLVTIGSSVAGDGYNATLATRVRYTDA